MATYSQYGNGKAAKFANVARLNIIKTSKVRPITSQTSQGDSSSFCFYIEERREEV